MSPPPLGPAAARTPDGPISTGANWISAVQRMNQVKGSWISPEEFAKVGHLVQARGAAQAVAMEQRDRRIVERRGALDERFGQRRAFEKREVRPAMKFGIAHADRGWHSRRGKRPSFGRG